MTAEAFYPFVDADGSGEDTLPQPTSAARIAVYDDMSMPPRVKTIEACDIRSYLEQITASVYELASQQGADWPFSLIRELVENYIHAFFQEPTVSILDKGQTLTFSDQGPGIADKQAALKPSFSSATKEMKRYIRGVGSGLPIVEEQMKLKHGTIKIEDNIGRGTIVTVSLIGDATAEANGESGDGFSAYAPQSSTVQGGYGPAPGAGLQAVRGQIDTAAPEAAWGAGAQYGHTAPYGYPAQGVDPAAYGYPPEQAPAYQATGYQPQPFWPAQGYPQAYAAPAQGMGAAYPPVGAPAPAQAGAQPYPQMQARQQGPGAAGQYAAAQPPATQPGYPYTQPFYQAPQAPLPNQAAGAYPQAYGAAQGGAGGLPMQPQLTGQQYQAYPQAYPYATYPDAHRQMGPAALDGSSVQSSPLAASIGAGDAGDGGHERLSDEQMRLVMLFAHAAKVGPAEVLEAGLAPSRPTATRRLQDLERAGMIMKSGQKYELTGEGRSRLDAMVADSWKVDER